MAKKKGKASKKASDVWSMQGMRKGKEAAGEFYEKLKKETPKVARKAKAAAAKAAKSKSASKAKAAAAKVAKSKSAKYAKVSGRAALKAAKALPGPAKIAGIAAVGLGTYIAGRRSGKRAGSKVNIGNAAARGRKEDYYG